MKKVLAAINGTSPTHANGSYDKNGKMSQKVSEVSLRAQNRNCKNRQGQGQGQGHVTTHTQRPFSTVTTSDVAPHSHQRRWSAEFCKRGSSPGIIVKKNKKEPQPPQRGVSLLRPQTASHNSCKRYSCPPIRVFNSLSSSSSSLSTSSSLSSTSSCSSPPPVQTSVITGPDPLGWKLRPKSSAASHRARKNRLSLQIPLPVISPKSSPAPNAQSDNTLNSEPETKPPLKPKPSRRRHSDSSAFLKSPSTPVPMVVTLEELCAVHLRPLALLDESDDVFSEEEVKVTARSRKIPPPVPEKTSMARQIAQLMAHSHQHCSLDARKSELCVDTSCDRERSTPRFPG